MAEQKRNTRNSKSTKIQPVNDYGRKDHMAWQLLMAVTLFYFRWYTIMRFCPFI